MSIESCGVQPRHDTHGRKSVAKSGHNAEVNEWLKLGSGEAAANDRMWVGISFA